MHPLHDAQRRRLLTVSSILCAIPLCLMPLAGRTSFELAGEQAVFNARFDAPELRSVWNEKPVPVARDPFVPEGAAAPGVRGRGTLADDGIVGMTVRQGDSMGFALPPNRGAAGTPLQATGGLPAITAVVTGSSPRALVDDGDRVRVVGIGDTLAGSRVMNISGAGVRLQNGALLTLTEDRL